MKRTVHFIINPAAGKPEPILHYIHAIFKNTGIQWDASISHNVGDVTRHTHLHRHKNDIIAVYGGDGTVMEAAEALFRTTTPLAIIPGGTANIMAKELAIPTDTEQSIELLTKKNKIKYIDMGMINNSPFLIRINIGVAADMVIDTSREMKDKFGRIAYGVSGIKSLLSDTMTHYKLIIDGKKVNVEGVSLIIANAGNIGIEGKTIVPNIRINDGKLDVILLKEVNVPALVEVASTALLQNKPAQYIQRWKAKNVTVSSDKPLSIIKDDIVQKVKKISVETHSKSLQILVP